MSREQVVVRKAAEADVAAIVELWKEFMDFHKECDPFYSRAPDGHEKFAEFLRGHLASERSRVFAAEVGGKVVGYCLATIVQGVPVFELEEHGFIYDLAVAAPFRRKGIGERLFREAKGWFESLGLSRIELTIATHNPVSRAFWKKMGFAPYVERLFLEI